MGTMHLRSMPDVPGTGGTSSGTDRTLECPTPSGCERRCKSGEGYAEGGELDMCAATPVDHGRTEMARR
jgi:hypothetical protein